MSYNTSPPRTTSGVLPPQFSFGCLIFYFVMSFGLFIFLPVAHAATPPLPYNENFEGTTLPTGWSFTNQTTDFTNPDPDIDTATNTLAIFSTGTTELKSYYSVYLNEKIDIDCTIIVQIPYITNTGTDTRAGLMIKNDITAYGIGNLHIQLAVIPNTGFEMIIDKNGDGTIDTIHTITPAELEPPMIWLKIIKSSNTYIGYYGTNGTTWTELGSVIANNADPIHLGLFGKSGTYVSSDNPGDQNITYFDNFALIEGATTHTYYQDKDIDGFGNPNSTKVTSTPDLPAGYVTNDLDCDDTNANVKPGASEICDNKDNDCDGLVDEGIETTTFYSDSDGDGYGDPTDTKEACIAPSGYVAQGGDCDDTSASINPGAKEICGDTLNLDEDCAGGNAVCDSDTICEDISDVPLSVSVGGTPSLIMFVLDDSGSMEWTVMCPEDEGYFNGQRYYTTNLAKSRWRSQWYDYNGIYYNPHITYEPWPNKNVNTTYPSAKMHPMGWDTWPYTFNFSETFNLTTNFVTLDGNAISYAHYYEKVGSDIYLVDLGHSMYYKVGSTQHLPPHDKVKNFDESGTYDKALSDITGGKSIGEARQNFANWFTYYRTRETAAKATIAKTLEDITNAYVGIHTINHSVIEKVRSVEIDGNIEYLQERLYHVGRRGYTPLRQGLRDVGRYFDDTDNGLDGGIGESPYFTSENGGDCQQAFAILMTDGYSNGGSPRVGDADNDNDTKWDGYPYGGVKLNRLPDVAMHFYERDLSKTLNDSLPVIPQDLAPHQHMVTYTVSFGVKGNLERNDTCPLDPDTCPEWPTTGTNEAKIDELWQAAVAGRGKYIETESTTQLAAALNEIFADISNRGRTAASISVSSEKLDTGLTLFQGFFYSADWTGDLQAYEVSSDGEVNLDDDPVSAAIKLDAFLETKGHLKRKIFTQIGGVTEEFLYTEFDPELGTLLTEDQVNYIRGDDSLEAPAGSFRARNSKLGSIVHSSPTLYNNVVYVGANDGMFHAFDGDPNSPTFLNELFAYVPSFVLPKKPNNGSNPPNHLSELTSPYYSHKYFVDGTATAKTVGDKTWVVSGLRKGGRGYFGIDVTNPSSVSINTDIWEYPADGKTDSDMGFTYGEVTIALVTKEEQRIFAANGYDSPSGDAVLYILKPNGEYVTKIKTNSGGTEPGTCNGLSTPLVVDLNDDGIADAVYAGDLLGNLWKFVGSGDSWDVAYKDGSGTPMPLFTARNNTPQNSNSSEGQVQPITSKPAAMFHCDPTKKGTIVVFGTGRMLADADLDNTNVQTIYGIWDWQEEWDLYNNGTDGTKYNMGAFELPSEYGVEPDTEIIRTLSNTANYASTIPITLLQQNEITSDDEWRYTTNTSINWFSPKVYLGLGAGSSYSGGLHVGWYLNLPEPKERVITKVQIRDGKAYIVSIIPEPAPCAAGGTTVASILDACNGGQLDEPQWLTGNNSTVGNPSGKKLSEDIYYAPAIIEDKLFFSKDAVEDTKDEAHGLFYWRIRE